MGRRAAGILLLAVGYVIAGRLGLMADAIGGFATLVWPPTGLALAALILGGPQLWPGVALGAFAVNLWVGASPLVAGGIALGNTLEAVLGASLLSRIRGFDPSLRRLRDVVGLLLSGTLSTLVSATLGVTTLWLSASIPAARVVDAWLAWWVGDAIGALVVAPLLLSWSTRPPPAATASPSETLLSSALLVAVTSLVFCSAPEAGEDPFLQPHVVVPLLVWNSVRRGPRGGTAAVFACSVIAVVGTALDRGPFATETLAAGLLNLQVFMAVTAVTCLVLSAATAERATLLLREQDARELAERSLQSRDEFLAVASHELKTPLTPLRLQLETIQRTFGETEGRDPRWNAWIDRALRQTARLSSLVETLLDVSRLATGQLVLERTSVDICQVVTEVVEQFAEEAARAESKLTLTIPSPVWGSWDAIRLAQIPSNLLANAIRYGKGHAIDVEITAEEAWVTLKVRDRGVGIDPDVLPMIFERFRRGSSLRHYGGLGLGLYVVREIARAHGGDVTVESALGHGSTFVVSLPRSPIGA